MPEDTPPGRVGRFAIRRELGRGTMGVVYEAHDATLERTVALKVVRLPFAASAAEREDFERRFLREARAAAALSHAGIVTVHEAGRDEATGLLYLALEHLAGRTLAEVLAERGRLPEREALRLGVRIARALDYAHRRGVVHRDVKPANVMLLPDGEVKLLDFGLAKFEAGADQTAAGQFLGTPLFVSPEQAQGEPVDGRSDLFSLGAILYTLLAGRRPFEGESVARILARVAHQPPHPLREANPEVSAGAEAVVLRALAKDPAARYPTGGALAEDLEDLLAGRPPRHGASSSSGVGEGTMVASRSPARTPEKESELPELTLEEAPAPIRRRGRSPLRALALTLLAGGLALYYSSISGPERLAEALGPILARMNARTASRPAGRPEVRRTPGPDAGVDPMPLGGGSAPEASELDAAAPVEAVPGSAGPSDRASAQPAEGAPSATPATVPSPEAAPSSPALPEDETESAEAPVVLADEDETPPAEGALLSAAGSPPVTRDETPSPPLPDKGGLAPGRVAAPSKPPGSANPPKNAELAIRLEHPLTRGTVRVWLDEKLVLRAPLSAVVSKKVLIFTFKNGRVRETLQVAPGKRRLKVEVRGEDRVDSQQVVAEFRSGVRRRLSVGPGKQRGRLTFFWS